MLPSFRSPFSPDQTIPDENSKLINQLSIKNKFTELQSIQNILQVK